MAEHRRLPVIRAIPHDDGRQVGDQRIAERRRIVVQEHVSAVEGAGLESGIGFVLPGAESVAHAAVVAAVVGKDGNIGQRCRRRFVRFEQAQIRTHRGRRQFDQFRRSEQFVGNAAEVAQGLEHRTVFQAVQQLRMFDRTRSPQRAGEQRARAGDLRVAACEFARQIERDQRAGAVTEQGIRLPHLFREFVGEPRREFGPLVDAGLGAPSPTSRQIDGDDFGAFPQMTRELAEYPRTAARVGKAKDPERCH
ncbi:MAG TPA: hypothetical protein VM847_18140 [Tahibacter sp.]|nr:hypothetical protein [Tahibacter sp.]